MNDKYIDKLLYNIGQSSLYNNDFYDDTITNNFSKLIHNTLSKISSNYSGNSKDLINRLSSIDLSVDKDNNFIEALKSGHTEFASYRSDKASALNHDVELICSQFPELDEAVNILTNAVLETDTIQGYLKIDISIDNENINIDSLIDQIEEKHHIKRNIKRSIGSQLIRYGQGYYYIISYEKILNRIEAISQNQNNLKKESFNLFESVQNISDKKIKYEQLKPLLESVESIISSTDDKCDAQIYLNNILENFHINKDMIDELIYEYGIDGLKELLRIENITKENQNNNSIFEGYLNNVSDLSQPDGFTLSDLEDRTDKNGKPIKNVYNQFRSAYVKFLPATQVIPCKIGDVILGYYYVNAKKNSEMENKQSFMNGVIDITNMERLNSNVGFLRNITDIIIKNFDKSFVSKNIDFMNDIVSLLMEQRFIDNQIAVTFIPVDDIIPLIVNADEDNNGKSMLLKSLYPARLYIMMMLNNIINILNNRPTRSYFIKRSVTNTNTSRMVQDFKRKLYSKRVGINDVNGNYTGTINKIGGISDMVIPTNKDGTPPFTKEYDEGANIPIYTELIEMLKRQALNQTNVPALLIDSSDTVEYSKVAEMQQAKFLQMVQQYKSDLSVCLTDIYRKILSIEYDIPANIINTFFATIPMSKTSELTISSDMINNLNVLSDHILNIMFSPAELVDLENKPSDIAREMKYELTKEYLNSLNFTKLEEMKNKVMIKAKKDELINSIKSLDDFNDDDLMEDEEK